jgi:hypothetical protein
MSSLKRDVVVAQRPGTRLFLAGGPQMPTSFEGPSERTIFFQRDTAEMELRRLRIPFASVELRPAKLSVQVE